MKKTISKTKLTLQRDAIRILNPEKLGAAVGGMIPTFGGCAWPTGSTEECLINTGKLHTCG